MVKNVSFKFLPSFLLLLLFSLNAKSQTDSSFHHPSDSRDTIYMKPEDTIFLKPVDTVLRIKNFSPYFTLHVDSTLDYHFEINKNPLDYYWYLKNSPVGLKINKDNGTLHFKADKSYFLSGKLKYDNEYKVKLGVQNLNEPEDKVDTTFTLLFYNTDIVPSRIKPTVTNNLVMDEGDTLSFRLQCDEGSFPLESITFFCNYPIRSATPISRCGDIFTWVAPYDFIKDDENVKQKTLILSFIGVDKFFNRDTAVVTIKVNQTVNYPQRLLEYNKISATIQNYLVTLKSTFRDLDKKIKNTKNTRTTFDLTSAATSLGGTVFSSMTDHDLQTTGKILPSVGVALVPVKEAVAPNKNDEKNSASLVRNDIKRLQYLLTDNILIGDKDPDIVKKISKMKDELQQVQLQLIDVPLIDDNVNPKELDEYFNNPKVNKKYRLMKK
ncbi:MAG TPA: hypothetical protein VLI68_15440 [Hanamia sp.]|jgi:hypothetical protein|nr:hypothetical protein [Hanamia sp.]